jgi:2-dehydro-3-deoxyphosphogluconate aldolase / (4S)-4-hydroxy-2-oxoglutarate aldolase
MGIKYSVLPRLQAPLLEKTRMSLLPSMSSLPKFSALLRNSRIIPVLTIETLSDAVPLARALLEGGIDMIEVTLRTKPALAAIEAIAKAVPEIVLGVGTLLNPAQVADAKSAGAQFLVTPGTSPRLAEALIASGLPALPGAVTCSEMLCLLEMGFEELKFFPAQAAGGVEYLKSVAGPLESLRFCPTGGITLVNAPTYLALPNVLCVGGSWLTPKAALAAKDFAAITALAEQASAL